MIILQFEQQIFVFKIEWCMRVIVMLNLWIRVNNMYVLLLDNDVDDIIYVMFKNIFKKFIQIVDF